MLVILELLMILQMHVMENNKDMFYKKMCYDWRYWQIKNDLVSLIVARLLGRDINMRRFIKLF